MTADALTCFAAGTRIATLSGAVAVEDLQATQVVRTAFAGLGSVTWVGRLAIECAGDPDSVAFWPVRISAGAFGAGLPERDLRLSRDHAVFVADPGGAADGMLIPIYHLINGATIAVEPVDGITYYYVELCRHDVLVADGLMVESGHARGTRDEFECVSMVAPSPDAVVARFKRCVPVLQDGPKLDIVRARLAGHGPARSPAWNAAVAERGPLNDNSASMATSSVVWKVAPEAVEAAAPSRPARLRRLDQYLAVYSEREYLLRNPDVARAVERDQFACGLVHYLTAGFHERRAICAFDEADYAIHNLSAQSDVDGGEYEDLMHHYVEVGRRLGYAVA